MSMTVDTPVRRPWARAHRAAVVITALCLMLAASLAVLGLRLATGSAPAGSVSVVHHLDPVDNGCRQAVPGQPC